MEVKTAGRGNRTLIASLEGWSFTTKLCPRIVISDRPRVLARQGGFTAQKQWHDQSQPFPGPPHPVGLRPALRRLHGRIGLISLVQSFAPAENAPLWLAEPKYWVFPLQAILGGGLVLWFWKTYEWGASWHIITAVLAGLVVLAVWISPQLLLGA